MLPGVVQSGSFLSTFASVCFSSFAILRVWVSLQRSQVRVWAPSSLSVTSYVVTQSLHLGTRGAMELLRGSMSWSQILQ